MTFASRIVVAVVFTFGLMDGAVAQGVKPGVPAAADVSQLNWAQKMFERQNVEFGVVARGAECTMRLKVKNIYQETIYFRNVSTSCGCSAAKPSANEIPSGQEAYIELSMDTKRFMRKKDSAALITLAEPTKGLIQEVRIPLSVYIRTDVVLTPGSVNFGAVEEGTAAERKIDVQYAGRPDWQIKSITSPRSYITAEAVEKKRDNLGTVAYDIIVKLAADAPKGAQREMLTIITDDTANPEVPLQLDAIVESEYSITPDLLALGVLNAGQTKTVNVVVRGRKPFKIEKIECGNPGDLFKVALPPAEKQVHVLPLTFTAPTAAGEINEVFTVTVTGRSEPLTFRAKVRVNSAAGG